MFGGYAEHRVVDLDLCIGRVELDVTRSGKDCELLERPHEEEEELRAREILAEALTLPETERQHHVRAHQRSRLEQLRVLLLLGARRRGAEEVVDREARRVRPDERVAMRSPVVDDGERVLRDAVAAHLAVVRHASDGKRNQ